MADEASTSNPLLPDMLESDQAYLSLPVTIDDLIKDPKQHIPGNNGSHRQRPPWHMDQQILHIFRTVVDCGGFAAARDKLGYSTYLAPSTAVHKLELACGHKLINRLFGEFDRSRLLTDVGRVVYSYAKQIDGLCTDLLTALSDLHACAGMQLTIGANESITPYLCEHLSRYKSLYPDARIDVRRSKSEQIPAQLLDGSLELGFIGYPCGSKSIYCRPVFADHLVVIVSPSHLLAKREVLTGSNKISTKELTKERLVIRGGTSTYQEAVFSRFAELGRRLTIGAIAPSIEMVVRFVIDGLGVALLPLNCVRVYTEVGLVIPIVISDVHIERKVYMVKAQTHTLSKSAQAFYNLFA